jgi:H2-forming N5,N10-methylenetetrahydromethanopterin dehydrogenase-like enzyme
MARSKASSSKSTATSESVNKGPNILESSGKVIYLLNVVAPKESEQLVQRVCQRQKVSVSGFSKASG